MDINNYPLNPLCKKHGETRMIYVASLPDRDHPVRIIYECTENKCNIQADWNLDKEVMIWR